MTGNRFKLIGDNNLEFLMQDKLELPIYDYDNNKKRLSLKNTLDLLNYLSEENEELKQQLFYDGDGVCDICKHEYLTPSGDYFISNCRKGHEECSKEDLRYCKDFEVKELKE